MKPSIATAVRPEIRIRIPQFRPLLCVLLFFSSLDKRDRPINALLLSLGFVVRAMERKVERDAENHHAKCESRGESRESPFHCECPYGRFEVVAMAQLGVCCRRGMMMDERDDEANVEVPKELQA